MILSTHARIGDENKTVLIFYGKHCPTVEELLELFSESDPNNIYILVL